MDGNGSHTTIFVEVSFGIEEYLITKEGCTLLGSLIQEVKELKENQQQRPSGKRPEEDIYWELANQKKKIEELENELAGLKTNVKTVTQVLKEFTEETVATLEQTVDRMDYIFRVIRAFFQTA